LLLLLLLQSQDRQRMQLGIPAGRSLDFRLDLGLNLRQHQGLLDRLSPLHLQLLSVLLLRV